MKTLLRIDASARTQGSHSRQVADYFQALWTNCNAGGRVLHRDLARDPVPHLDDATIAAFHAAGSDRSSGACDAAALSDALIAELESADELLLSSPLYNLGLPSVLKAYFDQIVRSGRTFESNGHGPTGLLRGKSAFLVTARGSAASPGVSDDFQTPYLRSILSFIGIGSVRVLSVEATGEDAAVRSRNMAEVRAEIDSIFAERPEAAWVGAFTDDDRSQIGTLRAAQSAAIERGDAEGYGRLCTDDIALMIPGRDMVLGRDRFIACEAALFRGARFASFRKNPERVERSGDLAIEMGRQEVAMARHSESGGVFAARQKYTHVFRKTAGGWRFAVLMSNACE